MTRKRIFVSIGILVAILTLANTIFILVTKGKEEVKDGLLQNSRVYMTDIYYENERIYYTVVNKTFKGKPTREAPYVQKKVNGEWEFVTLRGGSISFPYSCGAFKEQKLSFWVEYPENLTSGEYRLLFGEVRGYADGGRVYGDDTYIVGYFTIPAPTE